MIPIAAISDEAKLDWMNFKTNLKSQEYVCFFSFYVPDIQRANIDTINL